MELLLCTDPNMGNRDKKSMGQALKVRATRRERCKEKPMHKCKGCTLQRIVGTQDMGITQQVRS